MGFGSVERKTQYRSHEHAFLVVHCFGVHWVVGVPIQCKGIVPDVTVGAFAKLADVQFAAGDGSVDVGYNVMTEESLNIIIS